MCWAIRWSGPSNSREFCSTWIDPLGAALAVKEGTHHSLNLLTDRLPARLKRCLAVGVFALMAVFLGVMVWLRPAVRAWRVGVAHCRAGSSSSLRAGTRCCPWGWLWGPTSRRGQSSRPLSAWQWAPLSAGCCRSSYSCPS